MTDYTDDHLRNILERTRVIALVGFSNKPERPSFRVATYLAEQGYRVIPVNPGLAGQDFMGEPIVSDLADIPADAGVDMLDVFRRSEHVPPIVEAALAQFPGLKTVWLQIGVESDEARDMATAKGVDHIQNICPKQEHERLLA
ncbi:MAG: CoA-binding protein [Maritimibacter sp.]